MFKTETHLHTAEVSPCASLRAREMMHRYKDAGYSTVFVSDHFQASTIEKYGRIPWSEKMSIFLAGYYLAKCEGEGEYDELKLLEGGIFEFLHRIILTDIKPPIYHSLMREKGEEISL